jgi:hypothetical protein
MALHKLVRAQRIIERRAESIGEPLMPNVHGGAEMMGLSSEGSALFPGKWHQE